MAILGQITVDEIYILSVDSDPAASSTPAPIGSIATLDDNTNGRMWLKTGSAAAAWSLIPRQANSTQYPIGTIPFADANGNLISNTANLYWDATNSRLSAGLNAPAIPQSTIHLDRGTATTAHIRMTAGATTGQTAGDGTIFGIDATGAAEIRQYENSNINFYTNNLVRGSFAPNGQFLLGGTSPIDITGLGAFPTFQILGTAAVQMVGIQYSADTIGPVFNLLKSRGATVGAQGLVSSGDEFGRIQFRASDGVNFQAGASIRALVDGTAAAGSMPGYMILMTTPTGSTTPIERVRIDSIGQALFASSIRLGNGSDTTNGNIRFNGSEFLARIGGIWRVLGQNPISLSSTGTASTTSGTFSTVTSITTTPASGTYLVFFSANTEGSGQIALFIAAAQQTQTLREQTGDRGLGASSNNQGGSLTFMTLITVNGSQIVDVRFNNAGTGTFTLTARELILVPIAR